MVDDEHVGAVGTTDLSAVMTASGRAAGDDPSFGEDVNGVAEQGGQAEIVEGGQDGEPEAGTSSRTST